MSKLEYEYTYEDGVKAGNWLLDFVCEVNPTMRSACGQFTPDETLQEIYTQIWAQSELRQPLPCIEGFLSWVLKPSRFDSDIITFWGANELMANQRSFAPICELPPDSGIIQLGYWAGETDGDAWCLDLNWQCIRCIPAACCSNDINEVRMYSYGVFYSLWQWISYLRCNAWEKGWIGQA